MTTAALVVMVGMDELAPVMFLAPGRLPVFGPVGAAGPSGLIVLLAMPSDIPWGVMDVNLNRRLQPFVLPFPRKLVVTPIATPLFLLSIAQLFLLRSSSMPFLELT